MIVYHLRGELQSGYHHEQGYDVMESHSRQITLAIVLVLILAVAAIAAALIMSYDVTFDAEITALDGSASIVMPNREAKPVSPGSGSPVKLRLNQTLALEPGSTATITFDINGGRAEIEGPAEIRLETSQRTANFIGHLRGNGDYTLVVEQDGGTVRYYFDDADPPLEDADISIWVNHTLNDVVPLTEPCWIADISPNATPVSEPITCP